MNGLITKKSNVMNVIMFLITFLLTILLFIDIKTGLVVSSGMLFIICLLIRPTYLYLLLISLFTIEAIPAFPGTSYLKIIGILLVVGILLRMAMKKESFPEDSLYAIMIVFLFGGLLSVAFADNISVGIKTYGTYISLIFLYVVTRYFLRTKETVDMVLTFLIFSTLIMIVIVYFTGYATRAHFDSRISGGIGNPNEYAAYILVLFPLAVYKAMNNRGLRKQLFWASALALLLLLISTYSRGGALGLLGVTGIFVYYYSVAKMRQIGLLAIVIALLLFLIVPEDYWNRVLTIANVNDADSSMQARFDYWRAAVRIFLDHPITGVGIGNFKSYALDYGASKSGAIHNAYLEILANGGLVFFVPFGVILIVCWKRLKIWKNSDYKEMRDLLICLRASFVSIIITSMFISADRKKIIFFLFAVISSVYYIAERKRSLSKNRGCLQ